MLFRKEEEADWKRTEVRETACDKSFSSFPARRVLKYRLHNFTFPTMSWGRHRIFRCVSSIAEAGVSGDGLMGMETPRDTRRGKPQSSSREKLRSFPPLVDGSSEKEAEEGGPEDATASAVAASATVSARPWNLRTRRAACFAPGENGRNRYPSISFSHWQFGKDNLGSGDQLLEGGEQRQRRKFSVSLTRKEIEEDFSFFKGIKPPRRPPKRARIVQRQLDDLFPGFWLEEVTLDSYKVNECSLILILRENELNRGWE